MHPGCWFGGGWMVVVWKGKGVRVGGIEGGECRGIRWSLQSKSLSQREQKTEKTQLPGVSWLMCAFNVSSLKTDYDAGFVWNSTLWQCLPLICVCHIPSVKPHIPASIYSAYSSSGCGIHSNNVVWMIKSVNIPVITGNVCRRVFICSTITIQLETYIAEINLVQLLMDYLDQGETYLGV